MYYPREPVTTASTTEAFSGMFECRHCELETMAVVEASGSGHAKGRGTHHDAYKDAEDDANNVAARTLQFVKCPRCGKRDPAGTSYRIQMTIGAVVAGCALAGIAVGLGILKMRGGGHDNSSTLKWAFVILGAVLSATFYWRFRRPWANADKRTKFDASFSKS